MKTVSAALLSMLALCAGLSGCNKEDSGRGFQKDNPTASTSESNANVLPGKHSHGGKKKGKKKGGKSNDAKSASKPGKAGKVGKVDNADKADKAAQPAAPATTPPPP